MCNQKVKQNKKRLKGSTFRKQIGVKQKKNSRSSGRYVSLTNI